MGRFIGSLLPRQIEEARDADTFTQALEKYSEQIFKKYESPREARRFLNYLRLVATSSGQKEKDALKNLRIKYPDRFDLDLVSLAVLDGADSVGDDSEVKQYYKEQCGIFGLDEKTFQPRENGIGHISRDRFLRTMFGSRPAKTSEMRDAAFGLSRIEKSSSILDRQLHN